MNPNVLRAKSLALKSVLIFLSLTACNVVPPPVDRPKAAMPPPPPLPKLTRLGAAPPPPPKTLPLTWDNPAYMPPSYQTEVWHSFDLVNWEIYTNVALPPIEIRPGPQLEFFRARTKDTITGEVSDWNYTLH